MAQLIKVLVVGSNEDVRRKLSGFLESCSDIQVIHNTTQLGAFAAAVEHNPDVVLISVGMADGSYFEDWRQISAHLPDAKILFVASHGNEAAILIPALSGEHAILESGAASSALAAAIRNSVHDASKNGADNPLAASEDPGPADRAARMSKLAPQEMRVLAELAAGKTNKQIATALQLSDKTVRNYLRTIFRKLGVNRRTQAVAYFVHSREAVLESV
jgi:DNA-binding NarL/FixJ family response regulator